MSLVTEPVLVTNHSLIYNRPRADKWDQGIHIDCEKLWGDTFFHCDGGLEKRSIQGKNQLSGKM